MSIVVKGILGREFSIPEDRSYVPEEGLWVKERPDGRLAAGLTEPAVLLAGGIRDVEPLVEEGARVEAGQTVCLVLTGKLKYLSSPLAGTVAFAGAGAETANAPYETPLFFLSTRPADRAPLADAAAYAAFLARSEGAKNPGGATGGGSATCKAVYGGLRSQTLPK
ncbi:MAG: hypothetical protein HY900_36065 [Deltaproteobacteria bacterium]|nr:hypothetical protein [Deltaproteobacteria bacterium]